MLTAYFEPHVFRSPYLAVTEKVGADAMLWAFLLGPIYFWKKRAPVEALVLLIVNVMLLFAPDDMLGFDFLDGETLTLVFWVICAAATPALLSMCYLRKGWIQLS